MSVILRSNELHLLIYNYLKEAGLEHTAFTLLSESQLTETVQEYRYDIKAGQLLSLLEKALVLTQLENHIGLDGYSQCKEPIYLLKPHICKITEKVKTDRAKLLQQAEQDIKQCIKRTDQIYKQHIKEDTEPAPEPVSGINRFPSFNLAAKEIDSQASSVEDSREISPYNFAIGSQLIALCKGDDFAISILQQDGKQFSVQQILPCVCEGALKQAGAFGLTPQHMVCTYDCKLAVFTSLTNLSCVTIELNIDHPISKVIINPELSFLIAFYSQNGFYQIINTTNLSSVLTAEGLFSWRSYEEYVTFKSGKLVLMSLGGPESPILQFNSSQVSYRVIQANFSDLRVSPSRLYFCACDYIDNRAMVYLFENTEPLYVFDMYSIEESLISVRWVICKNIEYLVILTDKTLREWQIDLNSFSKQIPIDIGYPEILDIATVTRGQTDAFVLCRSNFGVFVYSVDEKRIEKVDSDASMLKMHEITSTTVAIETGSEMYFLRSEQLLQLFE